MPTTTPEPPKIARKIRRLPRLIALVAICAVLLVFVLPLVAREMIGAARLRTIAEQALSDALGRKVTIEGEVSVMFAPWFGLTMGPVTVAEAPGFGDRPMVAVRRLEMTIRMLPLTRHVVSPGSVRVRDLTLHLRRNAAGRGNWEDLTAARVTASAEAPGWEFALEPRDIRLENASVDFSDATTGRTMALRDVQLKTGRGQPFSFSLAFRADGLLPDGQLECHAGGKAALDPATGAFRLHDTLVETGLVLHRPLAPGGATPTRVVSRLTAAYDPTTDVLSLTGIDARLPGARLTGEATLSRPLRAPAARTDLSLDLDMNGSWREILGLTPATAPGSLVAAPPAKPVEPAQPGAAGVRFEASAPDAQGTPRAKARLTATADASGLTVDSFALHLPQGRIEASGRFVPGPSPVVNADLSAEDVDFDALPGLSGRASWPWPMPWPTTGRLDVRLALRHCRLANRELTEAYATGQGRDGLLRLAPVSIALPGGLVSLDARFDAGLPPAPDGSGQPHGPSESLGLDIRAAVQPLPRVPGSGAAVQAGRPPAPSRVRLLGRLRASGAKGDLLAESPDPDTALAALGLAGGLGHAPALDIKSAFSLAPGPGRVLARATLTGMEATINGAPLRGQITYEAGSDKGLHFDLAMDALDLDHAALPGAETASGGANGANKGSGPRASGKLRLGRLTARGVEARNVALGLTVANGRTEAAVTGGELFGGKLSGKIDVDATGHVAGDVQVAGAAAARLPGLPGSLALSGPLTAKADIDATLGNAKHPASLQATVEATSTQLHLGEGANKTKLTSPKAVLTLKGRRKSTTAFPCEASLVATVGEGLGLHDMRLTVSGPVDLDTAGPPANTPLTIEGSGWLRPAKPLKITLAGKAVLDGAGGFSASGLHVNAGGLPATLKLARKGADKSPTTFSLQTGALEPRRILADWGIALPQGLAADRLTKATVSLSGAAAPESLHVNRLAVTVDDVDITGTGVVAGYDPKRGKWDLRVDRLDWDAYFPRQPTSGPPSLAERRKPLNLRLLRELDLDADLHLGWLKKGNVTFDASTVTAGVHHGRFRYRQVSPRFYGGRFATDIRGDARDTALKMLIELKLESIEISKFLWDWAEGNTLDSGSATFILAARTSGENEEELRGNLAGNASLQITRGNLKVHEPASKPGEQSQPERIPFDVFSSSWLSKGGVAQSEDFRIESPRMRVTGKGFVDLRDESINLSLQAALAEGGKVPATIIGPLDGPKLTIDRSKILGDMVYRVLQGIVSIPGKAVTRILQLR